MNKYRKKRNKAKLSVYTMSKELGIGYNKYLMVEKGQVPLSGGLLDKFNETIDNAKTIIFERVMRLNDIKTYIASGKLKEDMIKSNLKGVDIAKSLNINSSEITRTFNLKATDDIIERVYDYIKDPFNKVIKEEKKVSDNNMGKDKINTNERIEESKKLNQQIKELLKQLGINKKQLSRELGKSDGYANYVLCTPETMYNKRVEIKKLLEERLLHNTEVVVDNINNTEVGNEVVNEVIEESAKSVEENIAEEKQEETNITPMEPKETLPTIYNELRIKNLEKVIKNQEIEIDKLSKQLKRYEVLIDTIADLKK